MSRAGEQTRAQILEAAREEFAARGFAASQTRDIATRSGIPKANLFYYFQSKENLYAQALETVIEPLLAASALLREDQNPRAALESYVIARLRITQEQPHASKALSNELMHGASHLPELWRHALQAEARRTVTCLQSWMARGLIATLDPHHLMLFIWSTPQIYAHLGWQMACIQQTRQPGADDYRKAASTITRLIVAGVAPPLPQENQRTRQLYAV